MPVTNTQLMDSANNLSSLASSFGGPLSQQDCDALLVLIDKLVAIRVQHCQGIAMGLPSGYDCGCDDDTLPLIGETTVPTLDTFTDDVNAEMSVAQSAGPSQNRFQVGARFVEAIKTALSKIDISGISKDDVLKKVDAAFDAIIRPINFGVFDAEIEAAMLWMVHEAVGRFYDKLTAKDGGKPDSDPLNVPTV